MIITEERRQQLIERINKHVAWLKEKAFNRYNDHSAIQEEVDIYEIALAALEAKAECWTDEEEIRDAINLKIGYMFPVQHLPNGFDTRRIINLYRALPVPVMKPIELPDIGSDDFHDYGGNFEYAKYEDALANAIRSAGYEVKE